MRRIGFSLLLQLLLLLQCSSVGGTVQIEAWIEDAQPVEIVTSDIIIDEKEDLVYLGEADERKRIFVWDSLESLTPVGNVVTIQGQNFLLNSALLAYAEPTKKIGIEVQAGQKIIFHILPGEDICAQLFEVTYDAEIFEEPLYSTPFDKGVLSGLNEQGRLKLVFYKKENVGCAFSSVTDLIFTAKKSGKTDILFDRKEAASFTGQVVLLAQEGVLVRREQIGE